MCSFPFLCLLVREACYSKMVYTSCVHPVYRLPDSRHSGRLPFYLPCLKVSVAQYQVFNHNSFRKQLLATCLINALTFRIGLRFHGLVIHSLCLLVCVALLMCLAMFMCRGWRRCGSGGSSGCRLRPLLEQCDDQTTEQPSAPALRTQHGTTTCNTHCQL
jgi:hypothetical protein